MKKLVFVAACLTLLFGMSSAALAAKGDKELDFGVGFATAPYDRGDLGWGLNFGGGYEFLQFSGNRNDTLQIRGDIGYESWSGHFSGFGIDTDLDFSRVPVSVGCRYYYPIKQVKNLRVFGQASLEISFDSWDDWNILNGKFSHDETNVGVTPGAGIEYMLDKNIFVQAQMKEHLISAPYFTMQGGIGFRF
ncbi:outer membrane beta-barrel protein [Geotalea sp. SG265]|uniref:outer membrane beta-barrel protein n=1 Tax=Geotalea sp. SG265 TaxID=2922867 RepID=UPI001FAFA929|nr:outer membrane beta-barrel protein [Geotalea sp. SG265]